ncbi:MAG: hypothetical protein EXS29_05880 [Pedosphaera sp.]|nr:hypothetical protein [Pedosphaera sp.]
MEPQPNDPRLQEIHAAILAGQKIQAIKLWRELTGAGLAEAKESIERITEEARAKNPKEFAQQPQPKGCLVAAVAMIFAGISAGLLFAFFTGR